MLGLATLSICLATLGAGDYLRPFDTKSFDQAAFDAESFGEKKGLVREADGLRVTLKPGEPESGWKTPAQLRIGGDFTISASLVIKKLPKPAREDGAAIGMAIATQNIDQPEMTLLRQVEPDGKDVYRPVSKDPAGGQGMMMNQQRFDQFGNMIAAKPPKPERHTFPARGQSIRLEFRRRGQVVRSQIVDDLTGEAREIGQTTLGPGDIAGVKLFASNRNGADPVEVLFKDLQIHADRISGMGTTVLSVYGSVVLGEPTALEGNTLIVGGPPPAPDAPAGAPAPNPGPTPSRTVEPPAPAPPPAAPPAPPPPGVVLAVPAAVAAPVAAPAPAAAPVAAPAAPAAAAAPVAAAAPAATVSGPTAPPFATPGGAPPPFASASADKPGAPQPAPQPPKARLALTEVASITFERSSVPAAKFVGQPNVDTTGPRSSSAKDPKANDAKKGPGDDLAAPPPGTVVPVAIPKVEATPNGIRDLHIALSGLREAAIQQLMIQCQTDKGQTTWQLNTEGSEAWPLTIRRAGNESWADVFLEPPDGDCNDKPLTITLTYADNQNANIQSQVKGHTDSKLAFDPKAPTAALDARVYLAGEEQLFGKVESITEEALRLTTPWGDRLDIPMANIVALYMGMSDHKETPESFARRVKARGTEDLLLARAKDGEVVAIGGLVESAKENSLRFVYQGKARSLPLKQVEGLILATRPAPKAPSEVRAIFALDGGMAISGRWKKIGAETWEVESLWGQTMKLPASSIRSVRLRGGEMAYLSDLEPSKVEEIPYFGRRSPYRKDVNLDGGPLKIDDQAIDKGLAVHSRTSLTYELDRQYETFEALVGFDESGKKKGRVDCRVFADDKELYANPDLRGDAPPVKLTLPVKGAGNLRLVVDFGADEDTGDRVIWGNARLYRHAPKRESSPPAAKPDPKK